MSFPLERIRIPCREAQSENALTPIKIPAAGRLIILGSLLATRGTFADVTVQEQMSLDASILRLTPQRLATFPGGKSVTSTNSPATA